MDSPAQRSTMLPRTPRRIAHSEMTERLLDSAAAALARYGCEGSRVSEIARRAGLTTGAIYARWPAKADLLVAAVDHALPQILPQHRLKDLNTANTPHDLLAMFGATLTAPEQARDVMIQAVGDAHNSDAIAASLARFLNEEAEQLNCLIEAGKDTGLFDPAIDTNAITLLCQAVAIGTHLVLSAGLEERNVPAADKWDALLATLVGTIRTEGTRPTPHPDI